MSKHDKKREEEEREQHEALVEARRLQLIEQADQLGMLAMRALTEFLAGRAKILVQPGLTEGSTFIGFHMDEGPR